MSNRKVSGVVMACFIDLPVMVVVGYLSSIMGWLVWGSEYATSTRVLLTVGIVLLALGTVGLFMLNTYMAINKLAISIALIDEDYVEEEKKKD